jgi:hypothetical protein
MYARKAGLEVLASLLSPSAEQKIDKQITEGFSGFLSYIVVDCLDKTEAAAVYAKYTVFGGYSCKIFQPNNSNPHRVLVEISLR